MIKHKFALVLLLALALTATLLVSIPLSVHAAGATYYVDGMKGVDTNAGTAAKPWKTLQKATATIRSADTVIITAGIYRIAPGGQWNIACLRFGPAGSPASPTTFKAAAGARVIITSTNGNPVDVTLEDYVRLDGLWFGGVQDYGAVKGVYGPIDHAIGLGATNGEVIGEGKQIVNSTIWGYHSGIVSGSTEYALIQGNRMLLNGANALWHGIYISGDDNAGTGGASTHVIIDNNILIGGAGYGVQAWHSTHDLILTRNFIASHNWGSVLDGSSHLEANNFFWKEKGQIAANGKLVQPWGPWLPGSKIFFENNVLGPSAWLKVAPNLVSADTINENAFANWSIPPGGWPGYVAQGKNQVSLTHGKELTQLGVSEAALDNSIAALKNSFGQPVETIYADTTIEPNLAMLRMKTPATSPLFGKGVAWFGQAVNIGTDAPAPATGDAFWAAFRALRLQEWNRFGKLMAAK